MAKLYVFGIGGTGSRVLESLTMMLAAGVDCGVDDAIVPIIIDFDENNGNYNKTKELIDNYIEVREKMVENTEAAQNKFFKTKIEKLGGKNGILLSLDRGDSSKNTDIFKGFIGYDKQISAENKAFIELLFSKETLNLKTSEGFQGNPNIGSVALNQFADNSTFKEFAQDFQDNNSKIFIVSSIFGGTGASGFPLLLKTLNSDCKDEEGKGLANWTNVKNAKKAAISVMPYFAVKKEKKGANQDSLVDSAKWGKMVKAALHYYQTLDKELDALYYIGDETSKDKQYDHHKGNDEQKNAAHFVELAAAMAILDFADSTKDKDNLREKNNGNTAYKEFGVADGDKTDFSMLDLETKNLLVEPLTRFLLFAKYMGYHAVSKTIDDKQVKVADKIKKNLFDEEFVQLDCYKSKFSDVRKELGEIEAVQKKFVQWLLEMSEQTRKVEFFDLETPNAYGFIKGNLNITAPEKGIIPANNNWGLVNKTLNKEDGQIKNLDDKSKRFLELFYRATKSLIHNN
jgi:hypothetical protein